MSAQLTEYGAGNPWRLIPKRVDQPELIDTLPATDPLLAENLADLRAINRWLGGNWLTIRALKQLLAHLPSGASLTIVDVATGIADIPQAVQRWARKRAVHAHILATDINPQIVCLAASADTEELLFSTADACYLPLADQSCDIAMCSLALHHLEPARALAMLCEMRRVARQGVIVNDIVRWWPGYWGAWGVTRLISRNPLTRHDGPLSVVRAYTRAEMIHMAHTAGLHKATCESLGGYRVALWARVPPLDAGLRD